MRKRQHGSKDVYLPGWSYSIVIFGKLRFTNCGDQQMNRSLDPSTIWFTLCLVLDCLTFEKLFMFHTSWAVTGLLSSGLAPSFWVLCVGYLLGYANCIMTILLFFYNVNSCSFLIECNQKFQPTKKLYVINLQNI